MYIGASGGPEGQASSKLGGLLVCLERGESLGAANDQGTYMLVTRLQLKNWRNFREIDIPLQSITFLLGPNASGKSNLLDAFRFLRDVSKTQGGGLQTAVTNRGGMSKLRCLHARADPEVRIAVDLKASPESEVTWKYSLGFRSEGKNGQRVQISNEEVWHNGEQLFARPVAADRKDPVLLTQTYLEQIQANAKFRDLAGFFASTTYLHLVPQLLRYADKIGGHRLEDDPYGQGFLEQVAKTPEKTRSARLRKIGQLLSRAVPQFKELQFEADLRGHPHLKARYAHHRPKGAWQSEEHFSDGTLRLIGLLWSLLEGHSMLLLEEPEISLNDAIVEQIPRMLQRAQQGKKTHRQVLLSTHSDSLLSNPGIDGRGVVILEPGAEGSVARPINKEEESALESGLSVAEVILPKTRPKHAQELGAL